MSKYKLTDKYTVNSESTGILGGARKYKRKSKGDLHPRSRSLSLGAVTTPKFTVVEIPPISPVSTKPVQTMDFLQLTQMNSKVNPFTCDQMYGYKVWWYHFSHFKLDGYTRSIDTTCNKHCGKLAIHYQAYDKITDKSNIIRGLHVHVYQPAHPQ